MGVSNLALHHVGSHFIVYVVLTADRVVVTAILHERMDVSTRVRELQAHSAQQVGHIRARLLRSQFGKD